ncbi:MAG: mevalonate kinase family protein [Myxococcota bacterium]
MTHRVPGRVCLLGEHNDWAGGAAIVVPMDRAVAARAEPADTLSATAVMEGRSFAWTDGEDPGPLRFVPAVAAELAARFGVPATGRVHLDGDLPPGRGFSSSAATCVAVARALAGLHGLALTRDDEVEVAYRAEHDRVGVACGRLDPLACAHGVPLFLRFAGDDVRVEPVPACLELAVGSFRAPRDTPGILATLGRHFRGEVPLRDFDAVRRVGAVRGAMEGFCAQAIAGRSALVEGDLPALGACMDACEEIYEEELMAAIPALEAPGLVRAVRALRAAGALGAKFSGAGGDGSVVGLYPPRGDVAAGVAALDRLGLDAFAMEVWCPT